MFDGYRLPDGDSIADLGGRDGAVLADLLRQDGHSDRRSIVFDLPGVVEAAHATLAAAQVAERVELVEVVAGSFFDAVPPADIYLMGGKEHAEDEFRALLDDAGFDLEQVVPTPRESSGKSLDTTRFPIGVQTVAGHRPRPRSDRREGAAGACAVPLSGDRPSTPGDRTVEP